MRRRQIMNAINLLRRIGGFVLAASLLFGTAIMSSTAAQARGRHGGGFRGSVFIGPRFGYGYGYYGYPYRYSSQYVFASTGDAENQGYQDGLKTGSSDARRGQSYDPERSHYFKDSGFGNFGDAYREGFSSGYSDGFNR